MSKKSSVPLESAAECVAQAVKSEAGGEEYMGQLAVAWVIRNRLYSGKFGDTACKIVYKRSSPEDCQFMFSCAPYKHIEYGKIEDADFLSLAALVLYSSYQQDPTQGALYFNNHPFKDKRMKFICKIGNHYFYKDAD